MKSDVVSPYLPSALEALLFLRGEPMKQEDLARAMDVAVDAVSQGLQTLEERLQSSGSGLRLLRAPDGVQLVTASDHAEIVERFLKAGMREQLTPAAAETLAIVAYRGPIHRAGIEAIRGVNSSFTLRLLAIRGLVERSPSPKDRRVFLYQISADALRHLGLTTVQDLPDYASLHNHEGMTALEAAAEPSSSP